MVFVYDSDAAWEDSYPRSRIFSISDSESSNKREEKLMSCSEAINFTKLKMTKFFELVKTFFSVN
jgi:hypothetical protein